MNNIIVANPGEVAGRLPGFEGTAVTLGNFDGCHLGHQKLISMCREAAREKRVPSTVLTFEPAPEIFFQERQQRSASSHEVPFNSPSAKRLFTKRQKLCAFTELGLDITIVQNFDDSFSQMSREEFYARILQGDLRAKTVVVGADFRFGHKRAGDVSYLKTVTAKDQCEVRLCDPFYFGEQIISSTRIRSDIQKGQVESAHILLGRPYVIEGKIVAGQKRGRKLGFPTANLGAIEQVIPDRGVYCGYVLLRKTAQEKPAPMMQLPREGISAVYNIGFQPTLNNANTTLQVEAHLMEGSYGAESLYAYEAAFYFTHRLREEQKFSSLDELKLAIGHDVEKAKLLLAGMKNA